MANTSAEQNLELESSADRLRLLLTKKGSSLELPALWLRERATTSDQLDSQSNQRLFNPHELCPDLSLAAVELEGDAVNVTFSDGYQCRFRKSELIAWANPGSILPEKITWNSASEIKRFAWEELDQPAIEYAAMKTFLQYGYIVLDNTPTSEEGFLSVARRFGFIKDTAHGRVYRIESRPVYNDLAYQSGPLAPHTDMPYSNPMPGVQLLQCCVNETSGGESALTDSLACCEQLKSEDPKGLESLVNTPVRFEYNSDEESIKLDHPLLDVDGDGAIIGVRYSPRLDYMPLMAEQELQRYHSARKRLGELFSDAQFQLRFRLNAGETMMFDNSRVLHGRTAYESSEGHRLLQGAYLDRDGPTIRYHTLIRDHGFN